MQLQKNLNRRMNHFGRQPIYFAWAHAAWKCNNLIITGIVATLLEQKKIRISRFVENCNYKDFLPPLSSEEKHFENKDDMLETFYKKSYEHFGVYVMKMNYSDTSTCGKKQNQSKGIMLSCRVEDGLVNISPNLYYGAFQKRWCLTVDQYDCD